MKKIHIIGNSHVYKDVLTRNKISKQFEISLKEKCVANQVLFVSIVDELLNANGTTKMEYFIDYCHLDANKVLPLINSKINSSFKDL